MQLPGQVEHALMLPPQRVAVELLQLDEDQWFDRKSARVKPRGLADAIIGFANAEGGVIVVGLSDGRVEGTDRLGRTRNELMQAPLDHCVPPVRAQHRLVRCLDEDGRADHLLVFEIPPGEAFVHASTRDVVYLRVGDENRRLTFAQRQELTFDRGPGSYEARPLPDGATRDLDRGLLQAYVEAVGASGRKRLLQARGLIGGDGRINIAGWLLFARHPQAQFPEAHVRILRYRGADRGAGARQQVVADIRCEGPIPSVLLEAQTQVKDMQPTRRALGRRGRFENVPLVPEDAWLEGIVNAVVHRSYSLAGDHVRVEIFDDRIEITSPGRFPGVAEISDDPLAAPRFARNPRIARVCADLDFGQELGEGIRRIYEEMRRAGLGEPVYAQTAATVRLILSGTPLDRAFGDLPPEARVIVTALRDAGELRTGEIEELLGRSRPVTLRRLRALEAAGIVRRIGQSAQDPHAWWELTS